MPGSVTSVFSEPEDFQTALREDGMLGMLIIGRGRFQARLTQITLHRLRLLAAEEHLSRIAFVTVPGDAHDPRSHPSREALEWHQTNRFLVSIRPRPRANGV